MKRKLLNKLFALAGFLFLAMLALNMNACSKDKNNNSNPYGQYGLYGPGIPTGGYPLANGIGVSGDGLLVMELTFGGQNGGQAGANGVLTVQGQSVGCAIAPGQYQLQTQVPGQYYNGDFSGIQLITQVMTTYGTPSPATITIEGWLSNQQDSYGRRHMFINANIPGCPTVFN